MYYHGIVDSRQTLVHFFLLSNIYIYLFKLIYYYCFFYFLLKLYITIIIMYFNKVFNIGIIF